MLLLNDLALTNRITRCTTPPDDAAYLLLPALPTCTEAGFAHYTHVANRNNSIQLHQTIHLT
jgi:hypothetical protein